MHCTKSNGTYLLLSEDADLSVIYTGSSKLVLDDRSLLEPCDSPPLTPVIEESSDD